MLIGFVNKVFVNLPPKIQKPLNKSLIRWSQTANGTLTNRMARISAKRTTRRTSKLNRQQAVVIGAGKLGCQIISDLSKSGVNVTALDTKKEAFKRLNELSE